MRPFFRIFALYTKDMILEVTFDVGGDVIALADNTTGGTFTGSVVVTHPDGFVQTVGLTNVANSVDVDFRTDSDGNNLQGTYGFVYTNDDDVNETTSIDFHYVAPTLNVECKIDYLCSKLTVTDKTSYNIPSVSPANTTITRDLVIAYPSGVALADVESSTVVTVVNPIYTGTFGIELETTLSWDFGTHIISDVISTSKECKVDEGESLCSLNCCMRESFKRWQNARCNNNRRVAEFEEQFRRVTSIATLAYIGLSCGDTKGVEGYVAEAKKIAGCDDCDCDGGSGKLVVGLCGASTTGEVDVTAGEGIVISEGGVISVDQTWLTTFVNNIISALDLTDLEMQVNTNEDNIDTIAQTLIDAGIDGSISLVELAASLETLRSFFRNHEILTFSYRFNWASGILTDNRDASERVVAPNCTIMNATANAGWVNRPNVTWTNAPSSNLRAELVVTVDGFQTELPTSFFDRLNVLCDMNLGVLSNSSAGKSRAIVHTVGSNGQNTELQFKVWFWRDDIGFMSQSFLSANAGDALGGVPHISFLVTGNKA